MDALSRLGASCASLVPSLATCAYWNPDNLLYCALDCRRSIYNLCKPTNIQYSHYIYNCSTNSRTKKKANVIMSHAKQTFINGLPRNVHLEIRSLAPGFTCSGNLRSTRLMRLNVAVRELASNGGEPTKNSYVSTPRLHTSAVESCSRPTRN